MTYRRILQSIAVLLCGLALSACVAAEAGDIDAGDAQVLKALKEAGSDLTKPHLLEFYIVAFPDQSSAKRFSGELDLAKWTLDIHQAPETSEWTVVAKVMMIPEIHAISELSAKFGSLAAQYGGSYDGWETQVVE